MGEEIGSSHFTEEDFSNYKRQLECETEILAEKFRNHEFADEHPVAGFELEAWLIDRNLSPAPVNELFLEKFNNPLASPELANFNIEINTEPRTLRGHALSVMHQSLNETWSACRQTASEIDTEVIMAGILPTVVNEDLTLANMSKMKRYRALNREVLHRRKGKPLVLDINGVEHLKLIRRDVMLESAATSFQLHTQVTQESAARYYNASIIASAPVVAVSANSPYLFSKDLWDETRIPLFEQAVATGGYDGAAFGPIQRVTFGTGYVRQSLFECFQENIEHYPVLLPVQLDGENENLRYLRLHNGTIWRWNRPLVGFCDDGTLHLRIEHRVIPSGPTTADAIANAAFYYGIASALSKSEIAPENLLDFDKARDNFYRAAQLGMNARLTWLDGKLYPAIALLETVILPMAHEGLEGLGITSSDRHEYLGIISERLKSRMGGTAWQRAYVKKHGKDMVGLTGRYLEQQNSGKPVHDWIV